MGALIQVVTVMNEIETIYWMRCCDSLYAVLQTGCQACVSQAVLVIKPVPARALELPLVACSTH
jgi:hypothetical protein